MNKRTIEKLTGNVWYQTKLRDLKPGNIVRVVEEGKEIKKENYSIFKISSPPKITNGRLSIDIICIL